MQSPSQKNRFQLNRKLSLLYRSRIVDNTSVFTLFLSAIVGLFAGLVSVAFERCVHWVSTARISFINLFDDYNLIYFLSAFLFSALLGITGYWLVQRFAPEAGGSGIPEIEGALTELRPVRWWRVLPVKFLGGICTLSAGMVLGREGPTVQLGGNVGRMISDVFKIKFAEPRHTLLATGAAAGMSAAFNAPLAGILFIIEEMRPHFHYNLISIKAVIIGVIVSSCVYQYFYGSQPVISIRLIESATYSSLWLYLVLGMLFGVIGVFMNRLVFWVQDTYLKFYQGVKYRFILIGLFLGGLCGIISLLNSDLTGGGFNVVSHAINELLPLLLILFLFLGRFFLTLLCFGSGAPGGIFAPTLALGTLFGALFGSFMSFLFPDYGLDPATFAIAGMGALFAATVRAPLTGIVLVMEMCHNYQLILPMLITCLGATMIAQACGGKPLYTVLLERTLIRQAQEKEVIKE